MTNDLQPLLQPLLQPSLQPLLQPSLQPLLSPLLARLVEPLASTTSELDALDERLIAIDEHAAKGRFDEAAAACGKLVDEGIYDLRPLPYALHAAFLEGGLPAFELSLRVLENLLGPSRAALAPAKRQESFVNKRLAWLFDTTGRAIHYHREQGSETWGRIRATFSDASLEAALAACQRVAALLSSEATAEASRALGQLALRLRDLRNLEAVTATPASPTPASARPPGEVPPPGPLPVARERPELSVMQVRVAPAFMELCRQLSAAQALLEKKDFLKAAVVIEAIGRSLESFDPRSCFPDLFAPFAALVAQHASPIEEATGAQGSSVWQALAQYAKVDLAGFVESSA